MNTGGRHRILRFHKLKIEKYYFRKGVPPIKMLGKLKVIWWWNFIIKERKVNQVD